MKNENKEELRSDFIKITDVMEKHLFEMSEEVKELETKKELFKIIAFKESVTEFAMTAQANFIKIVAKNDEQTKEEIEKVIQYAKAYLEEMIGGTKNGK